MPGMVVPRPVFLDPMRSKLVAWLAQKLGIVESYDCMARYGRYRLTAQPSSQPGEKTWTRLPSGLLERNSVKKEKKYPEIGDMLLDMAKSHVCEADMTRPRTHPHLSEFPCIKTNPQPTTPHHHSYPHLRPSNPQTATTKTSHALPVAATEET